MPDLFDWTPPSGYPRAPGWKERTTSKAAARRIAPHAQTVRDQVWSALRNVWPAGLTADEVAVRIGRTEFSVRPRLSELRAAEEIFPAMTAGPDARPLRRKNESGAGATVWVCKRPEGL